MNVLKTKVIVLEETLESREGAKQYRLVGLYETRKKADAAGAFVIAKQTVPRLLFFCEISKIIDR